MNELMLRRRNLLAKSEQGGGGYEVEVVWNCEDINGYSKNKWVGKSNYTTTQFVSNTNSQSISSTSVLKEEDTIGSNRTIILYARYIPRYIAITRISSVVSHYGRINLSNNGYTQTLVSLKNIYSTLKEIYDTQELYNNYYVDGEGFEPMIAVRTTYNTIVGCDDKDTLQAYLNNL